MQAADKQAVIRTLKAYSKGAGVITTAQFAAFLGVGHKAARKKLKGLPAFEGKYFLLTDVADLWMKELKVEDSL